MRKLLGIVVTIGLAVAAWPASSQPPADLASAGASRGGETAWRSGRRPVSEDLAVLNQRCETPPDDSRPMMRWWWFGPSVTEARLARELALMKEAGIGGVEIQPVYPLALDD